MIWENVECSCLALVISIQLVATKEITNLSSLLPFNHKYIQMIFPYIIKMISFNSNATTALNKDFFCFLSV